MSEPDPFASPYHQVNLPGRSNAPLPPGFGLPAPMPSVDVRDLTPPRPTTTTVAFWCWLAGVVLVVLVLPALFYTGLDRAVDDLLRDSVARNEAMTRSEAEIIARLTPIAFVLGFAVLSVPYVIGAVKVRSGREWARVLLTVLGTLGGVFGIVMLTVFASGGQSQVHWLLGTAWALVFLAVCALGIVAMYLPASNAYVRSVTR